MCALLFTPQTRLYAPTHTAEVIQCKVGNIATILSISVVELTRGRVRERKAALASEISMSGHMHACTLRI